jgi:hypothetical protein
MNETLISSTSSSSSSSTSSSSISILQQPQTQFDQYNTKNSLSFNEILQIFNSAISQEQAWAALYQILKEFKYLFENCLNLVFLNQHFIDLSTICFRKDGTIYLRLNNNRNKLTQEHQIYDSYDHNLGN